MHRIFLPIYQYLRKHKGLRYTLLAGSFLIFLFFGLKIHLEEDVIKLLPRSSLRNEVAFSDIGLIDKVFIQITSSDPENPVDPETLGMYIDEYTDALLERDTTGEYITMILRSIGIETALGAMDYGFEHLPSFIDTSCYPRMAAALLPEAIEAQMAENAVLMDEDMTGTTTQMVCTDPFNLRSILLEGILPGGLGGTDVDEAAEDAGGYAIVDGHFFCPDKTVALAFLSPSFHQTNSGKGTRFNRILTQETQRFEKAHPDARVLVHGTPLGGYSNASTIKKDLAFTVGISLLVILLFLLFCFRSPNFIRHLLVPVIYGTAFALACIYWIKGFMSLMALGCGAIVMGVALSYCLHILIHYYYVEDIETVMREESTPVFLGCLTTVGAFLGLLFTESEMLRDFGLFSTFLLVGNTLYALIFLPHDIKPGHVGFRKSKGFPLIERINNLPWDRHPAILVVMAAIVVAGIIMSPKVKFDADLRNLNYETETLRESQRLYSEKNEGGFKDLYFASYDNDFDRALTINEALTERIDSLKETGLEKRSTSLVSLLFQTTERQQERIDAWKAFWTPERITDARRNLAAAARKQHLDPGTFEAFFSLVGMDYQPGSLLEAGVLPEDLLSNYIEQQPEGRKLIFNSVAFEPQDTDPVTDRLVSLPGVIVLEPFYYCRDMVRVVHDDFSLTLLISSLFVLIVLLIAFRNFWIALISFLPMFLSWYVLQGLMAIFGLEFNMINIVISTFIFGIGVDYSIFVMEGLLQEARTGSTDRLEFHKVAIFFSAMVLVITVASLIFAVHPAISSIGIITLIGMASTILMAYSLEPFIFRKLCKVRYFRRSFGIKED